MRFSLPSIKCSGAPPASDYCRARGNQIIRDLQIRLTLDARGLLVRQRRGASERVVLVGERPLAQAVKSFERADPITLPFISPESKFDPGNLIGRLKKRFLKGLLLVKCAMILAKPVLHKCENKRLRMSIKGDWRRHGSEVVIRWFQRFFSRRFATRLRRSILSPLTRKKTSGTQGRLDYEYEIEYEYDFRFSNQRRFQSPSSSCWF